MKVVPLVLLCLTPPAYAASASPARIAQTCASYNRQSETSAERLNRELIIANGPLRRADLEAGRNPKLAAYLSQFAVDVRVHGLQGRPEPASLPDVRAHYVNVMSSPTPHTADPESALAEDVYVVAGSMAGHRYHATLHVPGFPPDFAYYDPALPLRLRGQTLFDYGGPGGAIRERWSNHDNKYRTGQLWRYMSEHPRAADRGRFRTELLPGSGAPGGLIDRDGDRLNAVFNGELELRPGDFELRDGKFWYGPPYPSAPASSRVTESEGLAFVKRWFTRPPVSDRPHSVGTSQEIAWLADDATLHGAGCDKAGAANDDATVGGAADVGRAGKVLRRVLHERLGPNARSELLHAVDDTAPYGALPISGWARVAFKTQLTGDESAAGTNRPSTRASVRYCAQWIMTLQKTVPGASEPRAREVWLNLVRLARPDLTCPDYFAREHAAARVRECEAHPGWCGVVP